MAGRYTDEERIARGQTKGDDGYWYTSSGYRIRGTNDSASSSSGTTMGNYSFYVDTSSEDEAISTLKKKKAEIASTAESAAREAYRDRMKASKNMAQKLAASGVTGGLEERTERQLKSDYEAQQKSILDTRNDAMDEVNEKIQKLQQQIEEKEEAARLKAIAAAKKTGNS
jgi:DNA polymerase II small subunit/DNA polymerase delta subunit B